MKKPKTSRLHRAPSRQQAQEKARKILATTKLKTTKGRLAILGLLLKEHGPFTAEEIHTKVAESDLDLVTVYRNMSAMEGLGILHKINLENSVARYEIAHDQHHHHHIMCTTCKKIETFEDCAIHELESKVSRLGYSQVRHSLEFFGVCQQCSSRK